MKTIEIITASLLMLGLLAIPAKLQAQDIDDEVFSKADPTYSTAVGIRVGETSGLTIKQFTGQRTALEGIIGVWPDALGFTLLVERYVNAFDVSGLNWYYGAGGHVAFETDREYYEGRRYYRGDDIGLGVDGMLGIEYKIPPIPFAVSLDMKPFVEVNTDGRAFIAIDPGLGVKVAF
jgi:hypothetical protein